MIKSLSGAMIWWRGGFKFVVLRQYVEIMRQRTEWK